MRISDWSSDVCSSDLRGRQQLEPAVLQSIGVLELIDQNMLETAMVMFAYRPIAPEQLECPQQQLRKLNHAFEFALGLLEPVTLDQALHRKSVGEGQSE